MDFYIISFFVSIIIFIFFYLCDYKKPMISNNNNYDDDYDTINNLNTSKPLFSSNNILLFGIIYIVATIISFYISSASISFGSFTALCPVFLLNLLKPPEPTPPLIKDNGDGDDIDPKILSKITDNIDIGFNPPNIENEIENENKNEIEIEISKTK
jgi:hypothetical protein